MKLDYQYSESFESRHNGPRPEDIKAMCKTIGVNDVEDLIQKTVPANIRMQKPLAISDAASEPELLENLQNWPLKIKFIKTILVWDIMVPIHLVILRNIMENPGWYTAYTPYQAEIQPRKT